VKTTVTSDIEFMDLVMTTKSLVQYFESLLRDDLKVVLM
jgi:hypothetical protein